MAGVSNTLPGAPIDATLPGPDIAAAPMDPLGKIRGWASQVSNLVSGLPGGVASALPGGALLGPAVQQGANIVETNQKLNEMEAARKPPPAPPAAPEQPQAQPVAAQAAPAAAQPSGYVTGLEQPMVRLVGGRGGVPAHDVQTRSTVANQAYDVALNKAENVNQDVGARNINLADERRQLYENVAAEAGERYKIAQDANAKRRQEYETRLKEFDAYNKAMPDDPIDPDRFWSSRSSSQKAAGFIAAALGGWLQGSGVTAQNSALAQLNTAIEQDVASQRASYEAKKGKLSNLQTAYGLAMQKYNDSDAAESAAKAYLLDQTKMRLEAEAAKKGTVDAINTRDTLGQQIDEHRAQIIDQGTKRVQAVAATPMYQVQGIGVPLKREEAAAYMEKRRINEQQGAIDITKESAKATTGANAEEKIEGDVRNIGENLSKTAAARNALAQAKNALIANPITWTEKAVDAYTQGSRPAQKWVLSKLGKEGVTEREQIWEEGNAIALNALTGAGMSEGEAKRAKDRADGARDTESKLAWINAVDKRLEAIQNSFRAGARPEAVRRFDRRLEAQKAATEFPDTIDFGKKP